ncbi:MAG TPA: CHAD domain-containing protein [Verrucomicrobiae bacterium]|nr:CHAD domain-containing protein [Verrucomicrobiae bacterium]
MEPARAGPAALPAVAWADAEIARERENFERARRRFVHEPGEERLHDVRTAGRRLRSLLDDVAAIADLPRLRAFVKSSAECTDGARDAAVQRELLARCADEDERAAAEPLLRALRKRERRATVAARKRLRRLRAA